MEDQTFAVAVWVKVTAWMVIIVGLYLTTLYDYLLFHSLVEIFSVLIAFGIFAIAWNCRRFIENTYFLFLGIAYLFVGGLDLIHALAYKGMGVFSGYQTNLPTQLWISARYMESISLLIAPTFIVRNIRKRFIFIAYILAASLILTSIFYWHIFPACFVEGLGLTMFKKVSEYVISCILIGAIVFMFKHKTDFDGHIFRLLIASILVTIGSELSFTFYISAYGFSNLAGHFLKAISFYLVYKAIIESSLVRPYSLIFRTLKQREEDLSHFNLELEKRVEQRTVALQKEINDRKHAQEELLRSRAMLQSVFDGISEPLFLLDKNLTIKILNKSAHEYYGTEGRDVLEKPCYIAFLKRSNPCEECIIASAVSEGRHGDFERTSFMKPERLERVVIYPVKKKLGRNGLFIIRISDITESKMLERRLIQNEKMASLGVLISGIAHEINNPNNYISVNIPILRDYLNVVMPIIDEYAQKHPDLEIMHMTYAEFREDIFELLDNVQHGSRQIKSIVRDLKGFSKLDNPKKIEKIDLKPLIDKVISFCRAKLERHVKTFKIQIPGHLPEARVESQLLEQILINLLINAAQAFDQPVDDNSMVNLSVSMDDGKENRLIIEVSDNGKGMDEGTMAKIFDPFFTTKSLEGGTGLGMYIVHNLVEKLDGEIEVDSRLGQGTHFKVILDTGA
ncbi:MAG: MASE3 domain-containing protein [Desulfobacterales bacterium]